MHWKSAAEAALAAAAGISRRLPRATTAFSTCTPPAFLRQAGHGNAESTGVVRGGRQLSGSTGVPLCLVRRSCSAAQHSARYTQYVLSGNRNIHPSSSIPAEMLFLLKARQHFQHDAHKERSLL